MSFLSIRFLDIVDIFLVAYLFYKLYMLLKGSVAINSFFAIFVLYLVWLIARALNMQMLTNILGQVLSVGVIAFIIVFQQEMRRFFLMISSRYFKGYKFSIENLFSPILPKESPRVRIQAIACACENLAKTKTGALIVMKNDAELTSYIESGDQIHCETTLRILENIFFKNSPLHDGAVIIENDKILAAGCVLPVSDNKDLPKELGLRHRAAIGISETSDAISIIVSEETGKISYSQYGKIHVGVTAHDLADMLSMHYFGKEFTKSINI